MLWALLILPLVLGCGLWAERSVRRIRAALTASEGRSWRGRARVVLQLIAVLAGVVGLAGPEVLGVTPEASPDGLTVAVGIDVSKSMLAEDVVLETGAQFSVSNRLNSARQFAVDLVGHLRGRRVGLYLFAKTAVEAVPPTRDHGFARYILLNTDAAALTVSGSDLRAAVETGAAMLAGARGAETGAIVLVTDGEATEGDRASLLQTAASALPRGVAVHCVGVGTDSRVFIPIRKRGLPGIHGFYVDKQGGYLQTRLEETTLQALSAATGGTYVRLDATGSRGAVETLVRELSKAGGPAHGRGEEKEPSRRDLSPVFLAASLLLYVGYILL